MNQKNHTYLLLTAMTALCSLAVISCTAIGAAAAAWACRVPNRWPHRSRRDRRAIHPCCFDRTNLIQQVVWCSSWKTDRMMLNRKSRSFIYCHRTAYDKTCVSDCLWQPAYPTAYNNLRIKYINEYTLGALQLCITLHCQKIYAAKCQNLDQASPSLSSPYWS